MGRVSLCVACALLVALAVVLPGAGPGASTATPTPATTQAPDETSGADGFSLDSWPLSPAAQRGRVVFEGHCMGCHGETGLGDGQVADMLNPRPRNFQAGRFKFRTSASGELPLLDDIVHVIRCGLQGSAMRSFPLMPEQDRRDVASYVLALADFGTVKRDVAYELDGEPFSELSREDFEDIRDEALEIAHEDVWPVSIEQRTDFDEDSVAHGRELYVAQCVACHGDGGLGDGTSSFHLRDWKNESIRPRDLTSGIFRAGSRPEDLFLRLRTGLNGTPMPAITGSDDDLWDLVHYIMSLAPAGMQRRVHPVSCEVMGVHR
jgi:mono/diheme cytochrome c family protein